MTRMIVAGLVAVAGFVASGGVARAVASVVLRPLVDALAKNVASDRRRHGLIHGTSQTLVVWSTRG